VSGESWIVALRKPADVALARKAALRAMETIGASAIRRTKFVTAVSEIARNAVVHAGGGVIAFKVKGAGDRCRVIAECRDRGPGIPDIEKAMEDGFTTARGMGLGLGGARRLVDRFEIRSEVGKGTIVVMEAGQR
jgi:serine/threonine-protein kinase RsbT